MMAAMSLVVQPEVADALRNGRAVVALESTIISHGMPYPAATWRWPRERRADRARRRAPCRRRSPCSTGRCRVGLDEAQLHAWPPRATCVKATTRDLPWLIATGAHGATTVAATMRIAALAGIRVFATGGIGGVHRGAATTFDVSADLTELAAHAGRRRVRRASSRSSTSG